MITIDDIRNVAYSKPYLWSVTFKGFPLVDKLCHVINDTVLTFRNDDMEFGPSEFKFPTSSTRGSSIQLEIYEDGTYSTLNWLREWSNYIYDDNEYTVRLIGEPDVAREMTISRLSSSMEPVDTEVLLVIPDQDIIINHTSEKGGTPLIISANFSVVGWSSRNSKARTS